MGTIAARKAGSILENVRKVIAMELFCACQGIDLRGKKTLGKNTEIAYGEMRKVIPFVASDCVMYPLINQTEALVENETIYTSVFKGEKA